MLLNELAQWAVLIFVAIFVLGLTRQLGNFLVPSHERVAHGVGPDVGKRLPEHLVSPEERDRIHSLMDAKQAAEVAFLIVGENCSGCVGVLQRLEDGDDRPVPLVVLSRNSGPEHLARLEGVADLALVDLDRLNAAGLTVTPFLLLADRALTLVHKQVAWNVGDAIAEWLDTKNGRNHKPSPAANGSSELAVLKIGGTES